MSSSKSPFKFRDLDVEVVGVYRTGEVFGDNHALVPLTVLQQTLGREGEISGMWVRAVSADLVPAAETAVRRVFGTGVDVLADPAAARLAAESAADLSRNAGFGAAVVALASAGAVHQSEPSTSRRGTAGPHDGPTDPSACHQSRRAPVTNEVRRLPGAPQRMRANDFNQQSLPMIGDPRFLSIRIGCKGKP